MRYVYSIYNSALSEQLVFNSIDCSQKQMLQNRNTYESIFSSSSLQIIQKIL
jgi:hypothetical protein